MRGFAIITLALALLALPSLSAHAQSSGGQSPAATGSPATSEADKPICKKEKETGSRLAAKKVCRTKAEWDEFYRQQRAETEQMQRNDMAIKTPK